ncbi:hypothetical protein DPEC_G00279440 [Dallia pectoralis]|uniref:Uncharacterized protein n=1 Tax=Dallia pectoralis TaxID=75939 RepID=A0ACC2FMB5_DALPE|nr:hypothetical protein DPEC_G00279440 [Dallia pectoralis]
MEVPSPCSKKSLSLSLPVPREQATLKPPQHLWRQPRTPIKIKHRGYSDNDRHHHRGIERSDAVDTSDRPGLRKSRMSWPSSFHGTSNTSIGNCIGTRRAPRDHKEPGALSRLLVVPAPGSLWSLGSREPCLGFSSVPQTACPVGSWE